MKADVKIRMIDRRQEVPHEGPMCDLLWSDPDGQSPLPSVQSSRADLQKSQDGECHLEEQGSCLVTTSWNSSTTITTSN